jgi:hypothetical protein
MLDCQVPLAIASAATTVRGKRLMKCCIAGCGLRAERKVGTGFALDFSHGPTRKDTERYRKTRKGTERRWPLPGVCF